MYDPKILDILKQGPPKGYIAGIGRGEMGFTTRSDIGPASRAEGETGGANEDENDERGFNEADDAGLFNEEDYDEEDEEADLIFAKIDQAMDERRKKRREMQLAAQVKELRKERPKIQQQFADLKRQLADVSADEWDAIPDIGDLSRKKRDKRPEKFTPVPDSVIESARNQSGFHATLPDGTISTAGSTINGGQFTDLQMFSATRGALLSHQLDQAGRDSVVAGKTNIDPKGYLTSLSTIAVPSLSDIGDLKKARQLMKSILQTDPSRAEAWMSAARLEEYAGNAKEARDLIQRGCEACPSSGDVWLEAVRLAPPEKQADLLAKAVRSLPQSVKIWLKSVELEQDPAKRRALLQQALARVPQSVKLWKVAVESEERTEDAKILLARAVKCVPDSIELWLALAGLEDAANARAVLNAARRQCPNSHEIWLAAAQLEEATGHSESVPMIVQKAFVRLGERGVVVTRDTWMNEAVKAESQASPVTAQAIVQAAISVGIEEEDRLATWKEDAEHFLSERHAHCARAVYAHALTVFPSNNGLWLAAVDLERHFGTPEQLEDLLKKAVRYCPQLETLWLMGAKEKWRAGRIDAARQILQEAFMANPNSEHIVLAAVKLESETGEVERARMLLAKARAHVNTPRIWMKSAVFERVQGHLDVATQLLDDALKHVVLDKLFMLRGQIAEQQKDIAAARTVYALGIKTCPTSPPLYLLAARLEEKQEHVIRARSLLERGRAKTNVALLWLESVRIEERQGNMAEAQSVMARALQACPQAGSLWAHALFMDAPPLRRARSLEALRHCEADAFVVVAVARMFWEQRALDKARAWFERGVTLNADVGDHWAWFYLFERQHGSEEQADAIMKRCLAAEPHHGEVWQSILKAPENARQSGRDVLLKVAEHLSGGKNVYT